MTRIQWDCVVWLGLALQGFLALEFAPVLWKGCPWDQLSDFVWFDIKWWWPVALIVTAFLFVLIGHFDRHWPGWVLASVALGGAALITIHLIVKELSK